MTTTDDRKPRRRNRRGQGAHLRTELLQAATRLLQDTADQRALTIRGVAAEAGIAPQSVYLHFADRAALVWAVYEHLFGDLTAAMAHADGNGDDPVGRLRARCDAYCRYGLDHPGPYQVLFQTLGVRHHDWDPDHLPGSATFRLLQEPVADILGSLGRGTEDAFVVTVCLWAGLDGLVSLRLSKPTFPWPPLAALIDHTMARLLQLPTDPADRQRPTPSHQAAPSP